MHQKRWITAVALLLPLLALLFSGRTAWIALLAAVVNLLALREYYRIFQSADERTDAVALALLAAICGSAVVWAAYLNSPALVVGTVFFDLMAAALYAVLRFTPPTTIATAVARQVAGVVYMSIPLASVVLLYQRPCGVTWLLLLLTVVFGGDTAAYYVGRAWGRHKLCPRVSPGKTVEGALGALATSFVAGAAVKLIALPQLSWPATALFCILASIAGQVGDLFESVLKRSSGFKDSGSILPGHGGVLDRIDGLLFAAPLAYLFQFFAV